MLYVRCMSYRRTAFVCVTKSICFGDFRVLPGTSPSQYTRSGVKCLLFDSVSSRLPPLPCLRGHRTETGGGLGRRDRCVPTTCVPSPHTRRTLSVPSKAPKSRVALSGRRRGPRCQSWSTRNQSVGPRPGPRTSSGGSYPPRLLGVTSRPELGPYREKLSRCTERCIFFGGQYGLEFHLYGEDLLREGRSGPVR